MWWAKIWNTRTYAHSIPGMWEYFVYTKRYWLKLRNYVHTYISMIYIQLIDMYRKTPNISGGCRRCSNYIIILYLAPGFNRLCHNNCKTRRETFKLWDLVRLILDSLRYTYIISHICAVNWIIVNACCPLNMHYCFKITYVPTNYDHA